MAEDNKLEILITADTQQLVQDLSKTGDALKNFGVGGAYSIGELENALKLLKKNAKNAFTVEDIQSYGKAIGEIQATLDNFKRVQNDATNSVRKFNSELSDTKDNSNKVITPGNKVSQTTEQIADSARRARVTLYSMNQVVRDAPFGFIAISNNIPVLLDQFSALSQETKNTGGAFKALGQAFKGPAGILFSLSAGISVVTGLIVKYGTLGAALNEIFSTLDATEKAQVSFNNALLQGGATALNEGAQIKSLVSILTDENEKRSIRNAAYNELKQLQPQILQNQQFENFLTKQGADNLNLQTAALLNYLKIEGARKAILTALQKESDKLLESNINLVKFTTGTGVTEFDTFFRTLEVGFKRLVTFQGNIFTGQLFDPLGIKELGKDIKNSNQLYDLLFAKLTQINKLKLSGPNFDPKAYQDWLKQIQKAYEDAAEAEENAQKNQINNYADFLKSEIDLLKAKISIEKKETEGYYDLLEQLAREEYSLSAFLSGAQIEDAANRISALKNLEEQFTIDLIKITKDREKARRNAIIAERGEELQNDIPKTISTQVPKSVIDSFFKLNDESSKFNRYLNAINATLENELSNTLSDFAGTFVDSILNGKNAIESLANAVKQLIVQLTVAIVRTIALQALTKAVTTGGSLPIGGTAGLTPDNIGTIFQSFLGFSAKAPSIGAGGIALSGEVVFVQRGTDLVGVLNTTNKRINRVG